MFENNQNTVEQLLSSNDGFRRLYNQHQQLDKQVTAVEAGAVPMRDVELNTLKKEKLMTKDHLARMMEHHLAESIAS